MEADDDFGSAAGETPAPCRHSFAAMATAPPNARDAFALESPR